MTAQAVADFLQRDIRTDYVLADEQKTPGFKVGGTWCFKRADMDGRIAAQAARPVADDPA